MWDARNSPRRLLTHHVGPQGASRTAAGSPHIQSGVRQGLGEHYYFWMRIFVFGPALILNVGSRNASREPEDQSPGGIFEEDLGQSVVGGGGESVETARFVIVDFGQDSSSLLPRSSLVQRYEG